MGECRVHQVNESALTNIRRRLTSADTVGDNTGARSGASHDGHDYCTH